MKTPYLLHFDVPCDNLSERLPESLTHRLAAATGTLHYGFTTADLAVQYLNLRPFYVEIFELDARAAFAFNLEVTTPQHFLFFMLQGQTRFSTPEGFYLRYAPEGHLAACFKNPGQYRVSLRPGRHIACCVTLDPSWLSYATEKLPVFHTHLETAPALPHAFLPFIRIDAFLRRRLQEVLALKRNGHGSLDGFLRLKFARILEYYGPKAGEKLSGLEYRAKEYLDSFFRTHGLTSHEVAKYFEVEERTLRKRFKAEFNLTLRDYYTARRLHYALDLMRSQRLPIKDVYYRAGYNDESTFRYQLRKYGLSRQQKI